MGLRIIDNVVGMEISFRRIDKCWQNAEGHTETDVAFFLEENNWDDFGYTTTYHLHSSALLTGGKPEYLGGLRIMHKGQTIRDATLEAKLEYQEKETRMFKRLRKESTVFINTLCRDCEQNDTASLKLWLGRRLADKEVEFGMNDWRCAVLRGMLAYPKLDIAQITYNKTNARRVSAGGA